MPTDPLPPDPESVEKWKAMPQNKPSREALPPMTGGLSSMRPLVVFAIIIGALILLSLLLGRAPA
jgi:hypothetical protein